jgi:hypothetical protein
VGAVLSAVVVRTISEIVLPNALAGTRYGLEFTGLGSKEIAGIERYVLDHSARNTR